MNKDLKDDINENKTELMIKLMIMAAIYEFMFMHKTPIKVVITEYLKVSALAQSNFVPIINHVWGSALSVAVNLHLLTAQPDMPGGLFPFKPMLEFDTTDKNITWDEVNLRWTATDDSDPVNNFNWDASALAWVSA